MASLREEDSENSIRPKPEAGDWMRRATVYQIYVRSFQDSTGNGVGDLRGVLSRLPHVVKLGADAIWLSPFFVSPMEDLGYDIADHCDVDPLYGSLEDFDELVAAAHGVGLKVMIDLVFSHTSDRHPWFRESQTDRTNARADWYVWADPKPDGTPPNNWLSTFGGSAWAWNRARAQYYLHDFLPSQPSLDFANVDVRLALLEIAEFWVERGVDAFRLDTMNSYFHDRDLRDNPPLPAEEAGKRPKANPFAQQLHLYDRAQRGDLEPLLAFTAAIELLGATTVVGEIGNRLKAHDHQELARCYTFALPRVPFHVAEMGAEIEKTVQASPDGRICWSLSNHDVVRHVTRFGAQGEDVDAVAKLSAALLACLPGAINIYQGEELGLQEGDVARRSLRDPYGKRFWPELKGRDGCRTPMVWEGGQINGGFSTGRRWLPVQQSHLPRCVERQAADTGSVLALYREAIAFRKRHPVLGQGRFRLVSGEGPVLAFVREDDEAALLCVFNLTGEPATFGLPPVLGTVGSLRALDGSAAPSDEAIALPGYGYFVGILSR
jgi:alpha-glucosidase